MYALCITGAILAISSLITSPLLSSNLIWQEGTTIIAISVLFFALGAFWKQILLPVSIIAFIFGAYFFRNPERKIPNNLSSQVLLSPADGRIVDISRIDHPEYTQKIAIFLSPLDVHVTRVPTESIVKKIIYRPGTFTMAWVPKSSEFNERNEFTFYNTEHTAQYELRQIAGTIARVIRTFTTQNAHLNRGELCGMIKFGSRVELLLPDSVDIVAHTGDYVYGGLTEIGLWKTKTSLTQQQHAALSPAE